MQETHSISAGLDYCGIGPQLAWLGDQKRVEFIRATDAEALEGLKFFARTEGVIFAMESSHAAAGVLKLAPTLPKMARLVVNMSGRGDKDLFITAKALDPEAWREFLLSESALIEAQLADAAKGGKQ
jgi:tryptophan synthase beta chain